MFDSWQQLIFQSNWIKNINCADVWYKSFLSWPLIIMSSEMTHLCSLILFKIFSINAFAVKWFSSAVWTNWLYFVWRRKSRLLVLSKRNYYTAITRISDKSMKFNSNCQTMSFNCKNITEYLYFSVRVWAMIGNMQIFQFLLFIIFFDIHF